MTRFGNPFLAVKALVQYTKLNAFDSFLSKFFLELIENYVVQRRMAIYDMQNLCCSAKNGYPWHAKLVLFSEERLSMTCKTCVLKHCCIKIGIRWFSQKIHNIIYGDSVVYSLRLLSTKSSISQKNRVTKIRKLFFHRF